MSVVAKVRGANLQEYVSMGTSDAKTCGAPDCFLTSSQGKPYCPLHTGMNPHALAVVQMIADREDEILRTSKGRNGTVDGFLWREIRGYLIVKQFGSPGSMAHALELRKQPVAAVLRAAAKAGFIASNKDLVWLTEAGREFNPLSKGGKARPS